MSIERLENNQIIPDKDHLYETVFQRYEMKYAVSSEQHERLMKLMTEYMAEDIYGESIIRNIYFDTDTYALVRRSLEKPEYKEKLRLRSYSQLSLTDDCFLELKKKFDGIVYKRRIVLKEYQAIQYMKTGHLPFDDQVSREIDHVGRFYGGLSPKAFISYDRKAYIGKYDNLFRVTMDKDIAYRTFDMDLMKGALGKRIFPEGMYLMEVKARYGLPMWLSKFLSEERIFQTSFSKYGAAYTDMLRSDSYERIFLISHSA